MPAAAAAAKRAAAACSPPLPGSPEPPLMLLDVVGMQNLKHQRPHGTMSGVQPLVDVLGLANRPVGADCVKWSEDGVLAVAAGHSAVLLRPGDLAGPRAFASPGGLCDVEVLHAPGRPAKPTEDAHHELAHLRAAAMVSQYPSLQAGLAARCLGWSPAGCSAAAGCLLAVVTNDHQVRAG